MTLSDRIAAASLKIGGQIAKDKSNQEQGYRYISADKILTVCGQALAEAGIAQVAEVVESNVSLVSYTRNDGRERGRYDAVVKMVIHLMADGEAMACQWAGMGCDYAVPDKALYKAVTSGHKYFIAKLLNVGAENEDSEHEAPDEAEPPKAMPPQKCPKCGGPMWDNRASKTNPKAPDYKCKDKSCGQGVWLDAKSAEPPSNGNNEPPPDESGWPELIGGGPEGAKAAEPWHTWKNANDAIQWGIAQGCFDHPNHASNAYDAMKREGNYKTALEMWTAWHADVTRRCAEKLAESVKAELLPEGAA